MTSEYRKAQSGSNEELTGNVRSFFRIIYNPETGEILCRTRYKWGRTLAYYAIFYSGLACFIAAVAFTWHRIIRNPDDPIYSGEDGLAWTPGVTHIPIFDPERKSTLMRYRRSNTTQIDEIRENMYQNFLADYEPTEWTSENGNFIDCTDGRIDPDPEKVCEFKLDYIRPCVYEDDYGWFEGVPCIILKLNRINNWEPENYESIDEVPDEIKDIWTPNRIAVKCFGSGHSSQENIGDIDYYPYPGWSFDYYPYIGQQGYKSPIVAVQFQNLPHRELVFVTCKAYTKNMVHHAAYGLGQTRFEIITD